MPPGCQLDLPVAEAPPLQLTAADVYLFPTNLDLDPNVGELTPQSQIELLRRALAEDWDTDRVTAELDAYAARHRSHD